jgi:hypothetical protein
MKKKYATLFVLIILMPGCTDKSVILKNHNFDSGDWLLVNIDHNRRTMFVIDDEKILKSNSNGLKVNFRESDLYTTCDGELKLFKNGELIASQDYLVPSDLIESEEIKKAYKTGHDSIYEPIDKKEFLIIWDSLKNIPRHYPTRYHAQPDDKDVIWYYRYD